MYRVDEKQAVLEQTANFKCLQDVEFHNIKDLQ